MSKFSFSFKKTSEKPKVQDRKENSVFDNLKEVKEEKIYVTSIENNVFKTKNEPIKKEELIIKLRESKNKKLLYKTYDTDVKIKTEREDFDLENETKIETVKPEIKSEKKNFDEVKIKIEKNDDDFDNLAKQELLNDTLNVKEFKTENEFTIKSKKKNSLDLPDVEDANYDIVKPDEFGMALLRGMGLKKEQLESQKPYQVNALHTGGVGLGFLSQAKKKKKNNKRYLPGDSDEDEIKKQNLDEVVDDNLKIDGLVCIEHGKHENLYGKIVYIDDGITLCDIKLCLSKEVVSVPVGLIRIVSKKEFKENGKLLNRSKYEDFKKKQKN